MGVPRVLSGLDLLPGRLIDWTHAASMHPAGCTRLLGDGSVGFSNETTDSVILERLSAIDDGEVTAIP